MPNFRLDCAVQRLFAPHCAFRMALCPTRFVTQLIHPPQGCGNDISIHLMNKDLGMTAKNSTRILRASFALGIDAALIGSTKAEKLAQAGR
jgi:hypothetical protein